MIRLVYALRRLRGLSLEDFHRHLRDDRGPLVAGHATRLQMRRYVQSYFIDDPLNEGLRKPRGTAEPYDAVENIWFDRLERARARELPEGARTGALLVGDEAKFVDFSRSTIFVTKERIIVDR